MELETAARRHFRSDQTVAGYIGDRAYKHRLEEMIDGTGQSALVVWRNNGWAQPDEVKTSEYPILQVDCWADPSRDGDGMISVADAEDKAWALYRVVDRLIHGVREVRWGAIGSDPGLLVISCARWAEPFKATDEDRHGRGVPMGDSILVSVGYAVHTVH